MKKLLSLLIVASAVVPLHARSDFDLEMREHQREMREQKAASKKALKAAPVIEDGTAHGFSSGKQDSKEALEASVHFSEVWKTALIALGEDANDSKNYPDLLLACDILISGDRVLSCGSDAYKKALEAESIKHHVLALKATNVLIAMHYKPDSIRLAAISTGIMSLEGYQKRMTEILSEGKKYRYAYDQNSLAGESFQKDVRSTWESPKEIAGLLEAIDHGGSSK